MELQLYRLETDPVLRRLVAPMNSVELHEMEEDIRLNGGNRGVRVWGRIILADHEYYEYCHRQNIPFCLVDVPLTNRTEATAWVCRNQLARKSLAEEMRKYLIGKQSIAERSAASYLLKSSVHREGGLTLESIEKTYRENTLTRIRARIGTQYAINHITVRKYEAYARSIDRIYQSSQEFVNAHLSGRLKLSFEKVESLASLDPDMIACKCQRWLTGTHEKGTLNHEDENMTVPVVSIKTMPAYDPDGEITSLSLTIPSWISSIIRVRNVTRMEETSESARFRLHKALLRLKSTTDKMIFVLRKETDGRL